MNKVLGVNGMEILKLVIWLAFVSGVGVVCFKLGQKTAWDYISANYIAIHKSAVIGPILIKKGNNGGNKHYGKNQSKKFGKKTSK
jgi:hypothetical protein